jgi:hypothetical protein
MISNPLEQREALLAECQALLVEVSEQRYCLSLLTKVRAMLLACIAYKSNRAR